MDNGQRTIDASWGLTRIYELGRGARKVDRVHSTSWAAPTSWGTNRCGAMVTGTIYEMGRGARKVDQVTFYELARRMACFAP
jgi:hypothetical protein